MMELANKIALVTGGSRGIGKGIVLRLVEEGATVAFCHFDDNDRSANDVLGEMKLRNGTGFADKVNVSKASDVEAFIEKAMERYGRLDVLVNNAGVLIKKPFLEHTHEEWQFVLDTNLSGSFYCGQAAGRYMARQKKGKIINIGSRAYFGDADLAAYSASKGAVIALTKCMALALGPYNVNVNCIVPGAIETEMLKSLSPNFREKRLGVSPLKRIGKPEDVANGVVFLSSDKSDFITGEILHITGGVYG